MAFWITVAMRTHFVYLPQAGNNQKRQPSPKACIPEYDHPDFRPLSAKSIVFWLYYNKHCIQWLGILISLTHISISTSQSESVGTELL